LLDSTAQQYLFYFNRLVILSIKRGIFFNSLGKSDLQF
jgi:hypothetical protein